MTDDIGVGSLYRITFWTGVAYKTAYVRAVEPPNGDGPDEWLELTDRAKLEAGIRHG